jgi:hypothetical protein
MGTTLVRRRQDGRSAERAHGQARAGPAGGRAGRRRRDGLVGTVVGVEPGGVPVVDFDENPLGPLRARTVVPITPDHLGCDVVLMFAGGDGGAPVVMGVLQPGPADAALPAAEVDGERITLTAAREIVLRCGDASITLTRAGKVLIRGEYVLTHAGGVNRVRGGSVQIN